MCIMLYSKRDGEWIKRARGNSSGAQTAREELVLASHGRDKDSSGPLICLWGDLAGNCLILSSNIQLEEVTTHLHQLGLVFGEPAAIKYNECTGTIETEKYFGRLHGT